MGHRYKTIAKSPRRGCLPLLLPHLAETTLLFWQGSARSQDFSPGSQEAGEATRLLGSFWPSSGPPLLLESVLQLLVS